MYLKFCCVSPPLLQPLIFVLSVRSWTLFFPSCLPAFRPSVLPSCWFNKCSFPSVDPIHSSTKQRLNLFLQIAALFYLADISRFSGWMVFLLDRWFGLPLHLAASPHTSPSGPTWRGRKRFPLTGTRHQPRQTLTNHPLPSNADNLSSHLPPFFDICLPR